MGERPHAHMVYIPTELFLALKGKCWSLKIGESSAILDCINESLYREGFIDEETYKTFKERYRKPLLEIIREREGPSVKVEVKTAKVEVQQNTIQILKTKKRPDYSKMTLEELERYRQYLKDIGDTGEVQFVAFEIKRRLAEKGVEA